MPKNTPVMRAPTTRERIMDAISSVGDAVSQQPLMRILGSLNRDLGGEAPPPEKMPDGSMAEWKIGMMPGAPGAGGLSNIAPKRSSAINSMYLPDNLLSEAELASRNAMRSNNSYLGKPLAPDVEKMHPAVPPEFHAVKPTRMPELHPELAQYDEPLAKWSSSLPKPDMASFDEGLSKIDRLRPGNSDYLSSTKHRINMNEMPSGKLEYMDPDVAEYMNPKGLDLTTKEGQRRLRFLTGK